MQKPPTLGARQFVRVHIAHIRIQSSGILGLPMAFADGGWLGGLCMLSGIAMLQLLTGVLIFKVETLHFPPIPPNLY